MNQVRFLRTNIPVRDASDEMLGRLTYMAVDCKSEDLTFAVLKLETLDGVEGLVVLPNHVLDARRVNQPDEIILGITKRSIQDSVKKYGLRWPDVVCPAWAAQFQSHQSTDSHVMSGRNDAFVSFLG